MRPLSPDLDKEPLKRLELPERLDHFVTSSEPISFRSEFIGPLNSSNHVMRGCGHREGRGSWGLDQ